MAHYRWIYLVGVAAAACSSVAVADSFDGSNNQMNFGFSDSAPRYRRPAG
jgi:hypothetical protein